MLNIFPETIYQISHIEFNRFVPIYSYTAVDIRFISHYLPPEKFF